MEKYINVLQSSKLFKGLSKTEIEAALKCLDIKHKGYEKNDIILLAGSTTADLGVVLSGNVQIVKEDIDGNRSILTELKQSDVFAEVFALARVEKVPVTVMAQSDCNVLFIDCRKIMFTCCSSCNHHKRLIENMLELIVQKNLMLNNKIEILSKKSIRERILTYLLQLKIKSGKNRFSIPFSREQLADYLCVNRSALSRELGDMRNEGIISFNKNDFEII